MDLEKAALTPPSSQPEPAPATDMISLLAWIEVNKKRLMIGGAVVIVLIAVTALVFQQQARKEVIASEALSEIRIPYNPATPAPAGTADALLKMANEHKGTRAAARALLVSASILFSERNYDEAQKRYNMVAQEFPGSPWLADAAYGIATSLDAQGKSAEALAKFEDFRKRYASSALIDPAKLAIARLYESSNKAEDAFKLYEEIAKSGANTSLGAEAGFRQEELLRLRPELAKLREPIAPPVTAMTNRPVMMTNITRITNMVRPTNTGSPSQPVQIKLNSSPAPAAPATPASPAPTAPTPANPAPVPAK